ncbi:hypothetical protein D5086_027248 [Populus alba]|uniref:Uncharacterized protein n=1 Tax=Populus alba TaxID=43335 RepID=A0ACC4AUS4_POPAL
MLRNSPSQSVSLFAEGSVIRNAVKLTESKRFAVCGRKCDVEQVAEAYTHNTDHPKFKGNSISATGASKSECRETHRVKAFRLLRKNRNAAKLTESKRFAECGRKCDIEKVAEAYILKEGSPEIQRQQNFDNRRIEGGMPGNSPSQSVLPFAEVGMPRNSPSQSVSPSAEGSVIRNAAKLTKSKRFAVCGRKGDVEQVAEAYMLKRDHPKFKATEFSATGHRSRMPPNSPSQSVSPFAEEV